MSCSTKTVTTAFLLLSIVCFHSHPAEAQTTQSYLNAAGNPNFSVNLPVPNGYINVANGNLHLEFPLATLKQRGALNLDEKLVYDSRIWEIITYNNQYWWPLNVPNSQLGWRLVKGNETGALGILATGTTNTSCYVSNYDYQITIPVTTVNYTWTDPSGTEHTFDAGSTSYTVPSTCLNQTPGTYSTGWSGYAIDASGYYATTTVAGGSASVTIKDSSGTQVYPKVIDRYGNYWSNDSNGNLVDDLGRTPVITMVNGNVTYYDVLAPNGPISNNGTRVRYTVTFAETSISTHFNQNAVTEYQQNSADNPSTVPAVQSIQLPDGSQYSFTYDSYGEIQTMKLPTGGIVQYGWSNFSDSYKNANRWLSSSTIDGYETTYTPSVITQCSSNNATGCVEQMNVHRPSGDETVYTLTLDNGSWDTTTMVYQGAVAANMPLYKISNTYDFSQVCPSGLCNGAKNVNKTSEVDTLMDTSQSTTIQTSYQNPESGQLTGWSKWDYGVATTGTPTRAINYGYTGFDVTSETHYDQNGKVASSAIYNYTPSATATYGIVAHGSANSGGPYLTSTVLTNNSPLSTVTSYNTFYDTGSIYTGTDFNGNTTTYLYDATDTFVTEVDEPKTGVQSGTSHVIKASYDPNTGAISSTDDENSVANKQAYTINYSYEPVAGRPYQINYPDGGVTTYTYPSSNETDQSVEQSGSLSVMTQSIVDSWGRPSQTVSGGITSTTTYDNNSRVYQTTTPSLVNGGSSTDGTTTTYYDALNRVSKVQLPNGSRVSASFAGNVVITTDELNHQKQQTYDSLGQLTFIVEADPGTGVLDLTTQYNYDGLGNVTCVEQHGGVSGTGCSSPPSFDAGSPWRVRRFYYNAFSQLRASSIPEHTSVSIPAQQNCGTPDNASQWTDCYSYDNNGNVKSKIDNLGVMLTYDYDALNRIIDGASSTVFYQYDMGTNGAGRLYSQSSLTSVSAYSYDVLGRISAETSCRQSNCPAQLQPTPTSFSASSYPTTSVSYDLAGNPLSLTYPDGRVVQSSYDTLNRLSSVVYKQWQSIPIGTTYWWSPTYLPPGQLASATFGNGIEIQAAFNKSQSLTSLQYYSASRQYYSKSYQWDSNATNLIAEADQLTSKQRQFGYDNLNRLVSAADYGVGDTKLGGAITISGYEGSHQVCSHSSDGPDATLPTCDTFPDVGALSVSVGASFTASAPYGSASTSTSLAAALASQLNVSSSPVKATVNGSVIKLVSIASGSAADYTLTGSSSVDFQASPSSSTLLGCQVLMPLSGGLNQQYTYDNWGNLTQMGGSSGFSQPSTNQNQVMAFNYDAKGRLIGDGFLSYAYDVNDMLSTSSDGAEYQYDGAGQRTRVSHGATAMEYYYFAGQLVATLNPATASWTDTIYAGSQRIAEVAGTQNAAPMYDLLDHVGSEVASVDSSGNVVSAMDYTPFGQVLTGTNADGYAFGGLLRDMTGLDHADARQYSSITGRWLVPDPYDGSYDSSNPQSFNRYSYAYNSPLAYVDTTGLASCTASPQSTALGEIRGFFKCLFSGGGGGGGGAAGSILSDIAGSALGVVGDAAGDILQAEISGRPQHALDPKELKGKSVRGQSQGSSSSAPNSSSDLELWVTIVSPDNFSILYWLRTVDGKYPGAGWHVYEHQTSSNIKALTKVGPHDFISGGETKNYFNDIVSGPIDSYQTFTISRHYPYEADKQLSVLVRYGNGLTFGEQHLYSKAFLGIEFLAPAVRINSYLPLPGGPLMPWEFQPK